MRPLVRDALDQGRPVGERPIRLAPLRHHAQPPVLERIHDGIERLAVHPDGKAEIGVNRRNSGLSFKRGASRFSPAMMPPSLKMRLARYGLDKIETIMRGWCYVVNFRRLARQACAGFAHSAPVCVLGMRVLGCRCENEMLG
jgi:hypothetical protein